MTPKAMAFYLKTMENILGRMIEASSKNPTLWPTTVHMVQGRESIRQARKSIAARRPFPPPAAPARKKQVEQWALNFSG